MATPINILASRAMDLYYTNYKSDTDFFDLNDFIFHAGAAVAEYYRQEYKSKYDELRSEKQEAVVAFSDDALLEETLKVEKKDGEIFVKLTQKVMGFPYDNQNIGYQNVFVTKPRGEYELERISVNSSWQLKYVDFTNRIFWKSNSGKIFFTSKGNCNIQEVRVLYVPGISENMVVPDGIVDVAIMNTVAAVKQIVAGTIVKKGIDNNSNKVMESELNLSALKP